MVSFTSRLLCSSEKKRLLPINPLKAELNPICHLLALLGGATIVVVSRLRGKQGAERCEEWNKFLALLGFEPCYHNRPARSLVPQSTAVVSHMKPPSASLYSRRGKGHDKVDIWSNEPVWFSLTISNPSALLLQLFVHSDMCTKWNCNLYMKHGPCYTLQP